MTLRYRRVAQSYAGRHRQPPSQLLRRSWTQLCQPAWIIRGEWRPPLDVFESPHSIEIKMELAGVREEDIDVTLYQDVLVVAGRREDERPTGVVVYHEASIQFGSFQAEIYLPAPVEADRVTARYDRGFLRITLPKSPPAQRLLKGGGV